MNKLIVVANIMKELEINYSFMTWDKDIVYPYFTGEYQESDMINENGMQDSTFILNGFTRNSWLELFQSKIKIQNYFNNTSKAVIAEDSSAVAVSYLSSNVIDTGDAELKRIEIKLNIKEWRVI